MHKTQSAVERLLGAPNGHCVSFSLVVLGGGTQAGVFARQACFGATLSAQMKPLRCTKSSPFLRTRAIEPVKSTVRDMPVTSVDILALQRMHTVAMRLAGFSTVEESEP